MNPIPFEELNKTRPRNTQEEWTRKPIRPSEHASVPAESVATESEEGIGSHLLPPHVSTFPFSVRDETCLSRDAQRDRMLQAQAIFRQIKPSTV